MSSNNLISATVLASGLLLSVNALAEPAVQAGESLESLSQAKISTTINGQPGSIQALVQSGQVRLINIDNSPTAASMSTPANNSMQDAPVAEPNQASAPAPQLSSSASQPINGMEAETPNNSLPESEQNLGDQPMQAQPENMPADVQSEVTQ